MDDTQGRFLTAENPEQLRKLAEQLGVANAASRITVLDGLFYVGETVFFRGSRFTVQAITPEGELTLKLEKREQRG